MKIKNSFAADFGHRLKVARIENKMNQGMLCEKAKISQVYLSQLERGSKSPSLEVAARIAKALDVSLDSLILEK